MSYRRRTSTVSAILEELENLILDDMKSGSGVSWWTGLSTPQNLLLADYAVGLTHSTAKNLALATMHAKKRTELQNAVDVRERFRLQHLASGRVPSRSDETDNLALEADGHMTGVFSAFTSTLDSFGALIVATTGMGPNIVRSTWSKMLSWSSEKATSERKVSLGPEHIEMIDDVVTRVASLVSAGPTGWLEWTIDYRNTMVHRAHRVRFGIADARDYRVSHPLPRNPAQTQGEALAMGRRLKDDISGREASETIELILETLILLAQEVTELCIEVWKMRRLDPQLHRQQPGLWPKLLQGRASDFQGAGTTSNIRSGAKIALGGTGVLRVQRSRQMDADIPFWRELVSRETAEPLASSQKSSSRDHAKQPKRSSRRSRQASKPEK